MDTQMNPECLAEVRPDAPDSEMIAEQWRLEEGMRDAGQEAFTRSTQAARDSGAEDQTAYGSVILRHRLEAFAKGIQEFLDEANSGKAGRRGTAARYLRELQPHTAAYLALKAVVSCLTVGRTYTQTAIAIGGMIEDEIRLSALRETERKTYDSVVKNVQKRVGYSYKRVYAIRVAKKHDDHTPWTTTEKLQAGAKLLDILIQTTALVEVVTQSEGKNSVMNYVVATESTLQWIEKRTEAVALLRPRYEPMVVPPRDWDSTYGGGYLSSNIPPLPMVKVWNRAYLSELESADMPMVYQAINAVQRTAWQVNAEVLAVMQALWDEGSTDAGLPSRYGLAQPPKPDDIGENEVARQKWRIRAAQVHKRNLSSRGARMAISSIVGVASRYAKYPTIYFPHQFDFRGRLYAVTTLSPQGSDPTKGLLRFAKGKPLGETGAQWLAYQGANLAGNDKVSLEDRVQWVLDNEEAIYACACDPLNNRAWCGTIGGVKIDSPWQFLAFCFEWKGYLEQGEAFVSRIPVAMDGSCSGIQHFSAMLRDPIGGRAVNLVPAERPQDVYGIVAEKVKERIAQDLEKGTADVLAHTPDGKAYVKRGTKEMARQWGAFGVNRKVTKRSVMTLAYGSKEYGFKQQLLEDIIDPAMDAATRPDGSIDRDAFPFDDDGYAAAGYMAKLIWEAVTVTLVAATQAMKWLQEAASLAAQENLPVRWTTPVGFPVMQRYPDLRSLRVDTVLAGKLVRVRLNEEQEELSAARMANGISPNFVHSCDAAHLTLTVAMGADAGITNFAMVHDSFGTTAADLGDFFTIVREAFVTIYTEMDVLETFKEEITAVLSPENREKLRGLPAKGALEVSLVRESRYCFA